MSELLRERNVAVIIDSVHQLPQRRGENYDAPYALAGLLAKAGVRFCIARPGDTFAANAERNLPFEAATAIAYGLPADEALKAITLYPAQILGVADRLGSLDVGKQATFIVTDGDPLEISTHVEQAYIQGRRIDLSNRQLQLKDKYEEKYRQLKAQGK